MVYFASKVLHDAEIKIDSARQICSLMNDIRVNFNSAVAFFEYLGFIETTLTLLIPTEAGKKLFTALYDGFGYMLSEICLNKVVFDGLVDITALRFDAIKGCYYIQRHGFPFSAALFRNVLYS
jgi:hypothetical protein